MRGRLRRLLSELRRSERGIALPMALMITVIAMGFAAVPVVASINAQSGDSHNQGTNEALAAAEAGAELAVLDQSQMLSEATGSDFAPCVEEAAVIATGGAESGWCPKVPAAGQERPKIGNASYAYQVRPCYYGENSCEGVEATESCSAAEGELLVQVVSTGYATVGGTQVTRRIELAACAKTTETAEERRITREKVETETKLKTLEEGGQPAVETEEVQHQNELGTKTTVKTEHESQLTTYTSDLETLIEMKERAKEEGTDVEYEEIPGETYYETVKTAPTNVWADGQIVGIEGLTMSNNAQVYNGGAGSNKKVSLSGSANVCGSVFYGTEFTTDTSTSKSASSSCAAGRTVTKGTITYPAITLPTNIATENSDSRLCTESACHKGEDPVPSSVWERGNMSYNSSNKQLSVNYSSLTLEGTKPYYLCQLILAGGSSLYAGSGKSITIYFAPPSSCPGLNGAAQLQIANGTYVYADASSGPKFLFVGNPEEPSKSKIELAGGAKSEQFVIYAPYSKVVANNGIEMTGAIIANTLELAGGASLNKYGSFSAPSPETFLSSTETSVEKHKEATKTSHPSTYIKEIEEHITSVETQIAETTTVIETDEYEIEVIEHKLEEDAGAVSAAREAEINQLEEKLTNLGIEWGNLPGGFGEESEGLAKQSFKECTAEPPAVGLAPDEGC
ncbi:MAG: hypothetical protein QM729_04695 [Solirubrobacterales bacterium]